MNKKQKAEALQNVRKIVDVAEAFFDVYWTECRVGDTPGLRTYNPAFAEAVANLEKLLCTGGKK